MITVFYCTREDNPTHIENIKKTCGVKDVEIIQRINKGEGLTSPYNDALNAAKNDIIVFIHDDITFETNNWGRKILKHFKRNPEYGILGVAGSKHLPLSAKWWEKPKLMYGQVFHTHEGKTWLSKYSEHLGNKITEVAVVDGVFFSVHKKRIKENFNANIKGFHFYDVDFSFRNTISGCKVGVHYDIKINHLSIGETNDEWEENRKTFAEQHKDKLPLVIPEDFKNRKLKVLLGCLSFEKLTGSELMVLETAKGLSKLGCEVTVVSGVIGNKFDMICKQHGIKTAYMAEPPGYKRGDGKWGFEQGGEFKPSTKGVLYPVAPVSFDIIHANHTPVVEQLTKLYSNNIIINGINSEIIDLEKPVINDNIKKYIAVRPSIKDYLITEHSIPEDKIDVIYNPIDSDRFNVVEKEKNNEIPIILFVGTMDYLRQKSILDLVEKCEKEDKHLYLVGEDREDFATNLTIGNDRVFYFPPTDKIEEFYHKCDETAGIMLGRTTIEGFLCGKSGYVYDVDKVGNINNVEYHNVPDDLSIFEYDVVMGQIKDLYLKVFNDD